MRVLISERESFTQREHEAGEEVWRWGWQLDRDFPAAIAAALKGALRGTAAHRVYNLFV